MTRKLLPQGRHENHSKMHESSLEFLRCPRCGSALDLTVFEKSAEIDEGFLECDRCCLRFPVIDRIPVLWDDFAGYLSDRRVLGGRLFRKAGHPSMRRFLKSCLSPGSRTGDDRTFLEQRWSAIYQNSRKSRFYSKVRRELDSLGTSGPALEYGSSVGIVAAHLSKTRDCVFGIDRSFAALSIAKKSRRPNVDYVVADFLSGAFSGAKFDLILALNVLDLVEPEPLLRQMSGQISGRGSSLVLSDPYDFDRGKGSVRGRPGPAALRSSLRSLGFSISGKTKNPSYLTWNLRLNPRATLSYRVDLVISKKL